MTRVAKDRRYDAVLIDCYATLLHEGPAHTSGRDLLLSMGVDLTADRHMSFWNEDVEGDDHVAFSGSRRAYKVWARTRRVPFLIEAGVEDARRRKEILLAFEEWFRHIPFVAYPDVRPALTALREAGVKVVVASNWDWDINWALEAAGITDLIDELAVSARIGFRKPHPAFYAMALDIAGVEPDRALFIGDNWSHDVIAPTNAGIASVHLNRSNDPVLHVVDRGPSDTEARRIASLDELASLVAS